MLYRHFHSLCRVAVAALGSFCLILNVSAEPSLGEAAEPQRSGMASLLSGELQPLPPLGEPAMLGEGLSVHEVITPPQLPGAIDLTSAPDDLWERLRIGFAMTNLNDDLVLHYQQWYQNRPEALRRLVERSRPYLHHIVEELEVRGMPTEIALLPMVESAFNPMAYSPAHASGLWQFIPATGKRFNLEQNWWHDQRRDVVASTSAALDYLQTIYEMHGDWHLALASYNWGEGAVRRAIEKNESRGLPTDYPSLNMPNETRHYVPKLQALKNIFGNPALMAMLQLPSIPNQPYFATLASARPMDLKTAARLANMSLEEFRHLNPAHNRPIIKPDTPMVLPAHKIDLFNRNLRESQAPLTQWQAYSPMAGERVSDIASRFGTTTAELIKVNGLPGNVRLARGSRLLVPGSGGSDNLNMLLGMDGSHIIIQPEPRPSKKGSQKAGKGKGAAAPTTALASGKSAGKSGAKATAAASKGKAGAKPAGKPAAKPAKANNDKAKSGKKPPSR